ncbi:hypothetical protein NEMBOFW57_004317 [Staphylotrichum longicolle]|uniref:Uncharacterized protein n=1 Tax=Staphylotrichum longicolle TaxID=669026 RepID=A0AAD4F9C3_9PEZI|nr:hypothetical protein NEMBOFW57_004317 [Staphylotrichum longicolle]
MMYSSLVLAGIAALIHPAMGSPACPAPSSKTTQTSTTTSSSTSTGLPASCTYRPTATWYATTGCAIACPTQPLCIADAFVVLPCGCSRAAVSPTTVTICPTRSPCYQCSTGYGIATITDSKCPPSSTPTAQTTVV